jgi:hypothetical protein
LSQFINVGEGNQYLYLRRKLEFGISEYTRFSTIVGVIGIVAQYITIPLFSEKFGLRDSTIILIDIAGCFIQTIILTVATAEWNLYVGACIAFLDATSYSMIRCMISKHVEPDEVGKILAFVGAFQAFIPIISSPIFGTIYRSTVESFPQAYLIVIAVCFAIDWGALFVIDWGIKKVDRRKAVEMVEIKEDEKVMQDLLNDVDKEMGTEGGNGDSEKKKAGFEID